MKHCCFVHRHLPLNPFRMDTESAFAASVQEKKYPSWSTCGCLRQELVISIKKNAAG
jgi:hypothetical protein